MRLYRTAKGRVVGTQDDARADGRGWETIEVPTVKADLIAFLNDNLPSGAYDSPAFVLGRSDAERGMTANPYGSPDLRSEWERGHALAFESGLAKLPSFVTVASPRNGTPRRARRARRLDQPRKDHQ